MDIQKVYIGIDPGLSGAIACVDNNGRLLGVFDMPVTTLKINRGVRNEISIPLLIEIFKTLKPKFNAEIFACLEKVHGMPKMGGAAMFSFGRTYGHLEALLAALEISYEAVPPQTWKKAIFNAKAKDKDAARILAMQIFPHASSNFTRKKDDGRAEAALMAEYMRRRQSGR